MVAMPISQVRNCNFGRLKADATGSSGVGYTLLDTTGSIASSRTTTGVYQTAPGIYGAFITFPDDFRGQVLWDTGTAFPDTYYATEAYNVEENDPRTAVILDQVGVLTGTVDMIGTEVLVLSGNLDAVGSQLNVVSGNVDVAVSNATQAAVNSYGTYMKLLQVSGSVESINTTVQGMSSSLGAIGSATQDLYDMQFGRWHIIGDKMIFYRADNVTEIARFNLLDDAGNPTMDAVFERVKI